MQERASVTKRVSAKHNSMKYYKLTIRFKRGHVWHEYYCGEQRVRSQKGSYSRMKDVSSCIYTEVTKDEYIKFA